MIQCDLVCHDTGEEDAVTEVVRVLFLRRAAEEDVEVVADMKTPTHAQTSATMKKLFQGQMVKHFKA